MISLEKPSLIASLLISIGLALSVAFVRLSVGYGNLMFYEGRYDESLAGYSRAIAIDPDSAAISFNIGNALYKKGEWEEAVAFFSKVPAKGDQSIHSRANYNSGNAVYMMGQTREKIDPDEALILYKRAVGYYKAALRTGGADPDADHNLGYVERKIGELNEKMLKQKEQSGKNGDSSAEAKTDGIKTATRRDHSQMDKVRGDNLERKDMPNGRDRNVLKDIRGRFTDKKGEMSREEAELLLQEIREESKIIGRTRPSPRMGHHIEIEKDW